MQSDTESVVFLAAHGRVQHDDRHIQSVLYVAISSTASVVLIGECHPWGLQECGKQDFSSCSFPELQTRILDEKGSRHIQWPEIHLYSRLESDWVEWFDNTNTYCAVTWACKQSRRPLITCTVGQANKPSVSAGRATYFLLALGQWRLWLTHNRPKQRRI